MVRRSVMGWQWRQDLESDVLIYFNVLPVPWFQTQKQPTKIPVRIVASLILTRFELRISKILNQDSTHILKVAPGRLLIIWWRSQYPQSQRTWSSKKYLQYCLNSIWMISPMFEWKYFNMCTSAWLCCTQRTISNALLQIPRRIPDDGTHGVPKHVRDFVHLLRKYSNASKAGFVSLSQIQFQSVITTKLATYTLFINLRVPSEWILKDIKYAYR